MLKERIKEPLLSQKFQIELFQAKFGEPIMQARAKLLHTEWLNASNI